MRVTKSVPVTQQMTVEVRRCDICGNEQSTQGEPGWLHIRGPYDAATDSHNPSLDVCSRDCANKALDKVGMPYWSVA